MQFYMLALIMLHDYNYWSLTDFFLLARIIGSFHTLRNLTNSGSGGLPDPKLFRFGGSSSILS